MVIGPAISTAVKVGQILYRIVIAQNRVIGKAYSRYPRQVRTGVQHGAGLGSIAGSVVEYYREEEQGGNIVGLPEKVQQRKHNRFGQTRNQVFNSTGNRWKHKKRAYCNCPKCTHSRSRG